MLDLADSKGALIGGYVYRSATLYQLLRTDATLYRFTDHDTDLVYGGYTYTPAGGIGASAVEKRPGIAPQNFQVLGLIGSDAILHEDLRQGLFHGAKITELLVDWRYPWAGAFASRVYWIDRTRFTGSEWVAEVSGLGRFLARDAGEEYIRDCPYNVGDTRCGVTLSGYKVSATVGTVTTERRIFQSNLTQADDYWNAGTIEWQTGDNAGLVSDVLDFANTNGVVTLELQTPADVDNGDTFDIYPGCDKQYASHCVTRYSNGVNFGGFHFMPGADRLLKPPVER